MKSEDGRAYQLSSSGQVVTFTGPGGEAQASGGAQETCPNMPHKPAFMCANRLNTCWSVGQVILINVHHSAFVSSSRFLFFRLMLTVLAQACVVLMAVLTRVKCLLQLRPERSDLEVSSVQM